MYYFSKQAKQINECKNFSILIVIKELNRLDIEGRKFEEKYSLWYNLKQSTELFKVIRLELYSGERDSTCLDCSCFWNKIQEKTPHAALRESDLKTRRFMFS